MKALVSGSHGFIGEYLVKALKEKDIEVIRLKRPWDFLPSGDFDYIFHLAAYGNKYNQKDMDKIFHANLFNTYKLLDKSLHLNYKAFINFSTSSVTLPVETFYSATKAGGQRLCRAYAHQYDKPIMSVRPYTVIGVGEQKEHLIPTLIRSCLHGKEMPFTPYPVHDFIDVEDLVGAVIRIVKRAKPYKGYSIPIGSGKQYSNQEILEIVEEITGKKANIRMAAGLRSYDTKEWVADISVLSSWGWKPKKNVEDIIKEMIEYEKQKSKTQDN